MNSGARVSIPNNVRKTIQNIKEITGNHSEDEIYAMLKECSMDPNETAQKLLSQDPFHEVRRKRDKKKEIPIKESTEPRWKPGMQGRGNRGGRGPYSSRHNSHVSNRNVGTGKENEINKGANETVITPATHEKKNKEKSIVASSSNIAPESPLPEKTSSVPDGHLSSSDPILTSSQESRIPVSTIKREWKPKPTNSIPIPIPVQVEIQVQEPETSDSIPVPVIPDASSSTPESAIPELMGTKQEPESPIPETKHVIIPNHLHVPEAEKLGFRFGSFDFNSVSLSESVTDTCPLSVQPSDEITEHIIEEEVQKEQDVVVNVITTNEEDDNTVDDVASSVVHEPKQETSPPHQQYPAVTFPFMPPVIGTHIDTESQPRVPSLVVQQSFDPTNYYPQFYRENDGRVSPFQPQGGPHKYNGNVISSQSSQEVGNSIMSTPLSTQATGSTLTAQQPLPVFRQPPGLHLPHYPPNYIPYGPYFSPFYIPNPAMHQFLSNGGFPQQGQSGNMFPGAPMPAGKYPGQQYKAGGNIGNPGGYGYNVNPGVTGGGNSGSNEDLGGPQFKENNNVYVTGQQSESPGVWIATPGRDIPGSFYNLPQGGQVAYTPPQPPTHPSFTNIYHHHHHPPPPATTASLHPLQTMAGGVDMVGPTSTMYQQQQPPPQINWPNNY